MRVEDIDMAELPPSFAHLIAKQEYLLRMYNPTTIDKDIPFGQDWFKYAYWMPKIKREFYVLALKEVDMEKAIQRKCNEYGIDYWFFTKHYKAFLRRLEWMKKNNNYTHLGELK